MNEIINNSSLMVGLINRINDALINECVIPEPHNLESYFLTGHCNVYAIILSKLFGDDATVYDNQKHIITKIGDAYYDVMGEYAKVLVGNEFYETEPAFLYESLFGLGSYDKNIDGRIVEVGVEAGKQFISEVMEKERTM